MKNLVSNPQITISKEFRIDKSKVVCVLTTDLKSCVNPYRNIALSKTIALLIVQILCTIRTYFINQNIDADVLVKNSWNVLLRKSIDSRD